MRTNKLQYMRPGEVINEKERHSIVYLPIGPLEWHSYHLPLGTDPLAAERTAERAAEVTGGVIMPTLFIGTEKRCSKEILDSLGFEDSEQYIVGMDYPANSIKSFYAREEIFSLIIRDYLRLLTMQGYKLIVLVNGHAANGQMSVLERLANEFNGRTNSKVMVFLSLQSLTDDGSDIGHATKLETAVQMAINADNVDLAQLPERNVPLKYKDWGIADMKAFMGNSSKDFSVESDPRDASVELGNRYLELYSNMLINEVEKIYSHL